MAPLPLRPERALLHPLWLGALALLIVNDHLLKGSGLLPGVLTGKLSDLAGLVMAPALFATLVRARGRRALLWSHLAIGVVFAAVNLSPAMARGFEGLMALGPLPWHITVDPSDLLALPALFVSWRLCTRAMARPVEVAGPITWLASGLGLVASLATSPPPPPPGTIFPSINADLVIGAASEHTLILRIRPLRETVHMDCAAALRSPTTALSRELFAPADAWRVEPGRVVQIQGDGSSPPTGECFAALVDGTLHRAGGAADEGVPVPLALVFWTARDFPPTFMTSTTDDAPSDRLLLVDFVQGRALWRPHAAIFPAPPEAEPNPIPGCEPAPEGGFVDWDGPIPVGSRTIEAIASAPDGCHRFTLTGAGGWFLCTGTPTVPFTVGDEVHVSVVSVGQSFRPIEGVRLLGDGAAAGKRLVVARGADLATFGDGDWNARDLPECDGSHGPCGNLVFPQELTITGAEGTEGAIEVMAGDAVTVGGTLIVHRAERIPIANDACLPEVIERDGLVFESVYFEPRLEE